MAGSLSESERLVAVETKIDIVIEQQKTTNDKLDRALPSFVTHQQLAEKLRTIETAAVISKSNRVKDTVITVLISAAISGLVGFFLANIVK